MAISINKIAQLRFYKGGIPGSEKFGTIFVHGGRYNTVQNNIFIECREVFGWDQWKREEMDRWLPMHGTDSFLYKEIDVRKPPYSDRYPWIQNLYEDSRLNRVIGNLVYKCGVFIGRGEVEERDNLVIDDNPGFVDAARGNYLLKDDSIVYFKIPGFPRIPFDKIGLYKDEYRTWLPSK